MGVVSTSEKDKAVKPPRRLSLPPKLSTTSPSPRSAAVKSMSPVSQLRISKPDSKGKVGSPADVSKPTGRKKFDVLSSASYWLSQVKLSESTSKHSLSLGFFKLAFEAGCEPQQRVRQELKSYALRHKILELGEPARELLKGYSILEELEQLQVSQSGSQEPDELKKTSKEEVHSRSKSSTSGNQESKAPGDSEPNDEKHSAQKEVPCGKNRIPSRSPVAQRSDKGSNTSAQKRFPRPSSLASNKDQKGKDNSDAGKPASETA
ncbi:hypothetical protein Taro_002927, partial [Colocasia esculenta]|nr:hypothetical protein [Colocasia esculenta]